MLEPKQYTDAVFRAHISSLESERDRLAAENAELREELGATMIEVDALEQLAAANATLDRLREVVRKKRLWTDRAYDSDCMHQVHRILYRTEGRDNG